VCSGANLKLLGEIDSPAKINSKNLMQIKKHCLVCSVFGVDAVSKLGDATYLLRIPAAARALLNKNIVAALI
jgi:hypothetical protein